MEIEHGLDWYRYRLQEEIARAKAAEADKDKIWRDYQVADGVAQVRLDEMRVLRARAEAAEADLLAVRLTLADMIDERDDARAETERLRALPQQIADAVAQHPQEENDGLIPVDAVINVLTGITGPLAGGSLWFAVGEWEAIVGSAAEADNLRAEVERLRAQVEFVEQRSTETVTGLVSTVRDEAFRSYALQHEVTRLRAQLADCWTLAGLEREKAKAEAERLRAKLADLEVDLAREIASTATAQAKMNMLHKALNDVQVAFANQEATFNRKRHATSDSYHPANVAMCKALAAMRD